MRREIAVPPVRHALETPIGVPWFTQSVFFVIPADAPPGPATFVAEVAATARGLQEHETSGATFEVVSP